MNVKRILKKVPVPDSLFLGVLTAALISEGLGVGGGRDISLYLLIISAPMGLASILLNKKKPLIPKGLTKLYLVFITLSAVSVLFSVNITQSIKFLALYAILPVVFIYSQLHRKNLKKALPLLIFMLSLLFCFDSMVACKWSMVACPPNGYQFVFSKFGSHNHLGDFLILPLTICFYNLLTKSKSKISTILPAGRQVNYSLLTILFLPFFLFSYSRSAYLSLFLTVCLLVIDLFRARKFKPKITSLVLAALGLGLSMIFLFSVASDNYRGHIFDKIYSVLSKNNKLTYKTPWGERNEFISEAYQSIQKRPLFGIGPGNFTYLSKEFKPKDSRTSTESAHNIFVDIVAENGIFAGIIFALIIFEVFKKSQRSILFYPALAMLLNFQTDYTYRIFSFIILFFVLMGINYEEKLKSES